MHRKSEERVFHRILRRHAERFPEKALLIDHERSYSYAEIEALSNRVANALRQFGLKKGDTCLLMMRSGVEYIVIWLATSKLGAILVPVNEAYRGGILRHQVNNSEADLAIIDAVNLDRFAELAPELTHLRKVILRDGSPELRERAQRHWSIASYDELFAAEDTAVDLGVEYFEPTAIFYTSGTTGPSKGVLYGHSQAYATALPMANELAPSDVFYMFNPLYHVGMPHCFGAILLPGATMAIRERFSIDAFWSDVRRFGATVTLMLGVVADFVYRRPPSPEDRRHGLRKVLMVPLLKEIGEFRHRFGVEVMSWFNMTEVATPLHTPGFTLLDSRSCGRPRAGIEARVVDEFDEPVPPGSVGELVLRPSDPWEFNLGYWKNAEATIQAWRNLWFHTGDLFYADALGNYHFVDRLKDAIRRRGENISSYEVEAEINAHPAVLESAVVAVASEHGEDEVKAVVVLKDGQTLGASELLDFLRPRMAYFMLPRFLEFRSEELLKTPTGKVRKVLLRGERTAPCWDREAAGYKVKR